MFRDCGESWARRLLPEVAVRYATAFAAIAPPGDILIGRDSRPSGKMLSQAIQTGLQAAGRNTIDGGIMATPTVGVQVMTCRAAGGIQITASHNPSPYNGLKLFSAKGRVIPSGPGQQVSGAISNGPARPGRTRKVRHGFVLRRCNRRTFIGGFGNCRCPTDQAAAFPSGFGFQSRGRRNFGAAIARRTWLCMR